MREMRISAMREMADFLGCERGAVTIDWVALSAGILMLGIAVVYGVFNTGVGNLSTEINSQLGGFSITQNPGTPPAQSTFAGG